MFTMLLNAVLPVRDARGATAPSSAGAHARAAALGDDALRGDCPSPLSPPPRAARGDADGPGQRVRTSRAGLGQPLRVCDDHSVCHNDLQVCRAQRYRRSLSHCCPHSLQPCSGGLPVLLVLAFASITVLYCLDKILRTSCTSVPSLPPSPPVDASLSLSLSPSVACVRSPASYERLACPAVRVVPTMGAAAALGRHGVDAGQRVAPLIRTSSCACRRRCSPSSSPPCSPPWPMLRLAEPTEPEVAGREGGGQRLQLGRGIS